NEQLPNFIQFPMAEVVSDSVNVFLTVDMHTINGYFNSHDPAPIYKWPLSHHLELWSSQGVLAQGAFEQYCYVTQQGIMTLVPVVHYQSFTNWYVEPRYNY